MKKNLLTPLLGVFSCFLLFSCVKDVDFDQAEDITATPVVELNLIYFDANANEFFDTITNTPRLTLSDTTEIRFLDDTDFQESLLRAEFFFRFTNSIPRDFLVDFQFLSEQNEETYATATNVLQGSIDTPVITEFTETVEGDQIIELTSADKVVVSVTIPSSDAALEGNLNLKSKTTYYLEIKERN
ncbi:MAG: hypothetical protein HKN48_02425 [Flavobacteriaceae bacterium]|nr:hypothetical protein [Flavobacteriaceae bacterium]